MLTFISRNRASAGRYGFPLAKLRRLTTLKSSRLLIIAVFCIVLVVLFGDESIFRSTPPFKEADPTSKKARFSLLVPATSSNADLCKLLLSGQILGYPTPILINYGATEFEDPYVQHLAKVEGILKYLDNLGASDEFEEDLVLIVDGYDLWFQLPAEVLMRRYYELNAAANARLIETYGERTVINHDIRQTIIFGPDKICWPTDMARPACWAVSKTTLDEYAFGPETAGPLQSRSQPRWLNSGTIIGPARDLKDLFQATLAEIHANHTTDSDQYYLAEVFGRQEFARLQQNPRLLEQYRATRYGDELVDSTTQIFRSDAVTSGVRTEFYIGIDYESMIFQTIAYWKQFLVWMRPSDSWIGSRPGDNPYALRLPADIVKLASPVKNLPLDPSSSHIKPQSWQDAELLYNTVTRQVPAMIHFTGEKRFRHIWWKKIWFQKHAKTLREASMGNAHEDGSFGPIGGYVWYNAESSDAVEVHLHGVGGAWSDRGGWFSWKSLCSSFERDIYEIPGDGLFHTALRGDGENDAITHAESDAAPGYAAFHAGNLAKSDEK